jgi:hypothetical protein
MKFTKPQRVVLLSALEDIRIQCRRVGESAARLYIVLPSPQDHHQHKYYLNEAATLGRACEKLIAELQKDQVA